MNTKQAGTLSPPPTAPEAGKKAGRRRRSASRKKLRSRTRGDNIALWVMVGVPAGIHIGLVWIPAMLTVILSFFEWDNLAPLSDMRPVGFRNYWFIFTVFEGDLFPALFNNFVLIIWLTICSAIGMLFAYLLDKNLRGGRIYAEHLLLPGCAFSGSCRVHLEIDDVLSR